MLRKCTCGGRALGAFAAFGYVELVQRFGVDRNNPKRFAERYGPQEGPEADAQRRAVMERYRRLKLSD